MPYHLRSRAHLPLVTLLLGFAAAAATAQQSATDATTDGRGVIPPEEYAKWERLGATVLSDDGEWLSVQISRVDQDGELRIRRVSDPDSVVVIPNGSAARFSDDGRWLVYRLGVGEEERERLEDRDQPVRNGVGIRDLRTGEQQEVEEVSSFALSPDGRYLAMRQYPPQGRRDFSGVDVVVRDLQEGVDLNFGNVSEFAWQDEGDLLAMIVDADGMSGNGLTIWDPGTGTLRPVHTSETRYSRLTWRDESSDLALMRKPTEGEFDADAWADTTELVMAFQNVEDPGATVSMTLGPATEGFPDGHKIVSYQAPRWSESGEEIFFGIQERTPVDPCEAPARDREDQDDEEEPSQEDEPEEGEAEGESDAECEDEDDEDPTVEIWHAGDVDIVPTQKVRAGRDRRENDLSVWHLGEDRMVRLEDELTESVQIVERATYAVGTDGTPYDEERMFGPAYRDVYVIDRETGSRDRVLERLQYFFGASPEGGYLLYLEDDEYWTYDVESGEKVAITEGLPTSFVDLADDHTVEQKPPFRYAGWLENDRGILIYDEFDVWRVAPDGSGGERVTWGAEENVRHRLQRLDFDDDWIAEDEPLYFSLYDDWREAWGYGRADRLGAEVEVLTFEEARVTSLGKAEDADVYRWRVEDFEDSPDVFVGNGDLEGRQITRTNPFQDDYLWGRSELVEYVNAWGDTLQGSLYYPATYVPGEQFPMITYIYEIRSNTVRSYQIPSQTDYYNFQHWIQSGYFVFQPDIVYRDRNPGLSAVANIEPAVEAVIETGMVDPDAIGLIGHSWGGYQTTFFVTQSDLFAAAVAGAPLTNLFSMYLSVYWNTGGTDARIFEISQGRMEVPFWEDEASYRANSPVFHIEQMRTPLLMAQGTEDGAVDFNQGVEFYNAARRENKDFVFLVYNDENHGFTKEPNRRDYHRRINEWFAHYLKGEPAPAWIEEGVPYLEQPGGDRGR